MLRQLTIHVVVHAYNGVAAIVISMSVLQQGLQCPKSLAYLFDAATAHGSTVAVVVLIATTVILKRLVGAISNTPADLTGQCPSESSAK
jgi:hypothetical protein